MRFKLFHKSVNIVKYSRMHSILPRKLKFSESTFFSKGLCIQNISYETPKEMLRKGNCS